MTDSPVAGRVACNGLGIAYLDWGGTGPPLLVLHPNGFCAGVYDPLARGLVDQCRVVGIDLRGHGGSDDVMDSGLLGNDAIAMDVLSVADHLGMGRFAILGVSFGGAVGIEVAVAAPERVAALEALPGWVWDPFEVAFQDGLGAWAQFVEREGHARVVEAHVESLEGGDFTLGTWVSNRRGNFNDGKLPSEWVDSLEALPGWVWDASGR